MQLHDSQGRPRVLCIVGPTASGKTAWSLQLAQEFEGEIINADARQAYQGIDIGSGKPKGTHERMNTEGVFVVNGIAHHLMDILPLDHAFSVAKWCAAASTRIKQIIARGHLPILVGGTGLYINALIDGYQLPAVEAQKDLRQTFDQLTLEEAINRLRTLDPAALAVVDLKNKRRVIRALEVVTTTGRSFTEQRVREPGPYDTLLIAPYHARDELFARADANIDQMIHDGWLEETRRLLTTSATSDAPGLTAIGYQDLIQVIREEQGLEHAIDSIKRATRQYIKRQLTWFKKDQRILWCAHYEEALEKITTWLK